MKLLAVAAIACTLSGYAFAQALHPSVVAVAEYGAKTWEKHCHGCHDLPGARGLPPSRVELSKMTADQVYDALTFGNMQAQGDLMGEDERQAVALHITGKPFAWTLEEEKKAAQAKDTPKP
jgi:hypothetical protein